jgi:hypothetical protein
MTIARENRKPKTIITNDTAENLIQFGLELSYHDRLMRIGRYQEASQHMDTLKLILKLEPDFKNILQEQINECLTVEDMTENIRALG